MNTSYHAIVGFLILLLGLVSPGALLAQEMVIDSASPSEAEQGMVLDVTINGDGFDKTVKEVKFLVHCEPTPEQPCIDDPGGIVVNGFQVKNSHSIKATINIAATAKLSSYDVALSTRGRGGKGTTYRSVGSVFTVNKRPNQELLSCSDVIENSQLSCTCEFLWNGDDAFLPELVKDCVTSETLHLKHRFRGKLGEDPGNQSTITAVPCSYEIYGQNCDNVGTNNFNGTSVISNSIHRATVRFLDIVIESGLSAGCGGQVKSAISFVLDKDTPDPKTTLPIGSPDPDPAMRNSMFWVADMGIYSLGYPLCNAVEIIRTPDYTEAWSTSIDEFSSRDWKIQVTNTVIFPKSYEQAGIVMLGMMPLESINPPTIFGNDIYGAACNANDPVGIFFGDLTANDPGPQIEGVIESNTIDMASNCVPEPEPIGVMAVGEFEPYPGVIKSTEDGSTTVKINKNNISGAFTGIDVDGAVVEVNFSGNTLKGDGDVNTLDTGINSDAKCARTKGKPNRISGYNDNSEPDDSGCP